MSATPRPARLSKPGEVVAILVASAAVWIVLLVAVGTLFFAVFIPAVQFGGRNQIPADFPVYPNAHLESAISTNSRGCNTADATWSTQDRMDQVVAFYTRRLPDAGYTISGPTPGGGGADIGFVNESDGTNGSVFVSDRGGQTVIELILFKGSDGAHCAAL